MSIMIIGALAIALGIWGVVGGFIVWVSTWVVARFRPPFMISMGAAIAAMLLSALINWVIFKTLDFTPTTNLINLAAGFVFQAAIFGQLLQHPEEGPIGFGKGALVTLFPVAALALLAGGLYVAAPVQVREEFKSGFQAAVEQHREQMRQARVVQPVAATSESSPRNMGPSGSIQNADEAQREALRLYPALGVKDSAFNKEFCARYRRYQVERPDYFKNPAWPLALAEETKRSLLP